jgi:hypothetical protein
MEDPGWVFYPTDLQFFVDFELKGRERREHGATMGQQTATRVPDAAAYLEYQVAQGKVPVGAVGGLYSRVFLKHFLGDPPPEISAALYRHYAQPKQWHGSPITCLRRAFAATGTLRLGSWNAEDVERLRRLQDLYFGVRDMKTGGTPTPIGSVVDGGGPRHGGRKNDDEYQSPRKRVRYEGEQDEIPHTAASEQHCTDTSGKQQEFLSSVGLGTAVKGLNKGSSSGRASETDVDGDAQLLQRYLATSYALGNVMRGGSACPLEPDSSYSPISNSPATPSEFADKTLPKYDDPTSTCRPSDWVLGPQTTANAAVDRFAMLFQRDEFHDASR